MRWRALYAYALAFGIASIGITLVSFLAGGKALLWGITTGESKLGGLVWRTLAGAWISSLGYYKLFPLVNPLKDFTQAVVIGIILGGLAASLASGEFAVKHVPNRWMALQALIGGFLLGYGTRLALGCNIGNILSGWASAGLNAVSFTAGTLLGLYVGNKLFERVFFDRGAPAKAIIWAPSARAQRAGLAAVLALLAYLASASTPLASVWLIFGVAFGAVGYLGRLCWATGLRELVDPKYGDGRMARAIAIIGLTYALGVWAMYAAGLPMGWTLAPYTGQIQIFIGGILFGLGMGIAGTCVFSSGWRAGAGSIYSLIVFLSTILIGMPTLALTFDAWNSLIPVYLPGVTLYKIWGPFAVVVPVAFWLAIALAAGRRASK